jgi:hypothetical protein
LSKLSKIIITITFILFVQQANAQNVGMYDTIVTRAIVVNGDTLSLRDLEPVTMYTKLTAAQKAALVKYNRLRNAVYVTYPYAMRAGAIMNEINYKLIGVTDKKERKKYIKSREKELRKEFTSQLTNLSIYQGKVLMKLINRETGSNCFEIISEMKSGVTAGFYQTVLFFFDTSLKQSYDGDTEDALVEKFVKEVQRMYGVDSAPHAKII